MSATRHSMLNIIWRGKTRPAVAVGLAADIIATACAIAACRLLL